MVILQVLHDFHLMGLVDQGHDPFVDPELFEVAGLHLVLHIHQGVADAVNVVLSHARSQVHSPWQRIIGVAAPGLESHDRRLCR